MHPSTAFCVYSVFIGPLPNIWALVLGTLQFEVLKHV